MKKKSDRVSVTFAMWLVLLNGLIYCLGAVGLFEVLFASFGGAVFKAVFVGFNAVVLGLLCLPYHAFTYLALRWLTRRKLVFAVLFLLPGMMFGVRAFCLSLPEARARRLLEGAGLAALPESASKIRVYSWSTPFSGDAFLRFEADENDIEKFIDQMDAQMPGWRDYPENTQLALANMAFQMGISGLIKFEKMFAALDEGDYNTAADEALDSLWARQTPNRAERVTDVIRSDACYQRPGA